MRTTLSVLALATAVSASLYGESNLNHTCQLKDSSNTLSCSKNATPLKVDSCCVETYGGLFLATQFWSTYTGREAQGQYLPKESWGVHGLWPDFCDGSYTQYCDLNRQYDPVPSPNTTNGKPNGTAVPAYKGPNVGTFIEAFGRLDLLEWMNTYWISQNEPNSNLWAHEFSKHATCFSTFDVPCYGPKYVEHQELIEYYETAVSYFRDLPTYDWLSDHGITPCNETRYSLSEIQRALSDEYGAVPYVGCSGPRYNETAAGKGSNDTGRTVLSETWYFFNAYGRPQSKDIEIRNSTTTSGCAKTAKAILYPTRSNGSEKRAKVPV